MTSPVLTVATKEFKDCLKNFWLACGSLVFILLSLATIFGTAAIGGDFTFRPLDSVLNSLVALGVFMIPLIAILISYDAFIGEQEQGTLLLLLTYPISRTAILAGKFIGRTIAFALCLFIGLLPLPILSVAGALPYSFAQAIVPLLTVFVSGVMLGAVFILVSYAVSLTAASKARALGILLVIWLVTVFLYDLGLLILTISGGSILDQQILSYLMVANPVSAYRVLNQEGIQVLKLPFSSEWLFVYIAGWIGFLFMCDRCIFLRRIY